MIDPDRFLKFFFYNFLPLLTGFIVGVALSANAVGIPAHALLQYAEKNFFAVLFALGVFNVFLSTIASPPWERYLTNLFRFLLQRTR